MVNVLIRKMARIMFFDSSTVARVIYTARSPKYLQSRKPVGRMYVCMGVVMYVPRI